eukprot:2622454-Karenia_brevis.AAC.1
MGHQCQMCVRGDKSSKQRRTEVCTKCRLKAVQNKYSEKRGGLFANKKRGTTSYRWIDIAKIDVPGRDGDPLF